MQFNDSRRDFLTGAAKAGVAATIVTSVPTFAGEMLATPATAAVDTEALLHTLGKRIGAEVGAMIGSFGSPLSLTYADAAGAGIEALREGMESGARKSVGCGAVCLEEHLPYGTTLGIAYFKDPVSGNTARVEIFPEALSQIEMIADATRSGSLQKQAVLTAPADSLYSISVSSQLLFN
jgi:hypothetical protein